MTTTNQGSTNSPALNQSRTVKAPRELVFRALSEADHLQHWWAPKGATVRVERMEFRPDGVFHYCQKFPNGLEVWGKFIYRDIVAPERIVFTNAFSDAEGNLTRNPWAPVWPLEILNTWTLSEHDGKTTISLHGQPFNATQEECAAFEQAASQMEQGFKGTFDQLDELLARLQQG